jgi:hypothetical protein
MPPNTPFPAGNAYIPRHLSDTANILEVIDTPEKDPASQRRNRQESQPNVAACVPPATDLDWKLPSPFAGQQISPEVERDDPYEVSDEDIAMGEYQWQDVLQDDHLKSNDLGIVVALQAGQDSQGLGLRSYTSFIDRPDMLATYMPSSQATPMSDRTTAMIFCHFVNVTGPSMSIFERHPSNPSLIFQGTPVPRSQQHIWSCMPDYPLPPKEWTDTPPSQIHSQL